MQLFLKTQKRDAARTKVNAAALADTEIADFRIVDAASVTFVEFATAGGGMPSKLKVIAEVSQVWDADLLVTPEAHMR